jgi:hypothetical protein
MPRELSPIHHLFLQSLLSHRNYLSRSHAEEIYKKCGKILDEADPKDFATFLVECRKGLESLDFDIKTFWEQEEEDEEFEGQVRGSEDRFKPGRKRKEVLILVNTFD